MMATRRLRASLDSLSDTGPVWAHDISLVAFAALAVHRSGRATPTLRGTDKRQSMEMVGAKPSPAVETNPAARLDWPAVAAKTRAPALTAMKTTI
jgi:hypothetical protein